jgi:hypothetical protein
MKAKTGDLILFSSSGWVELMIKWYTSSPITHCGIVFIDWKGKYGPKDEVYLMENHPSSLFDHFHHRKSGINSPILVSLKDKLYNYNGLFMHCSLSTTQFAHKSRSLEAMMAKAHYKLVDKDFIFAPYDWVYKRKEMFTCVDYCKEILLQSGIILKEDYTKIECPGDLLKLKMYLKGVFLKLNVK